jgi:hypothetical protein
VIVVTDACVAWRSIGVQRFETMIATFATPTPILPETSVPGARHPIMVASNRPRTSSAGHGATPMLNVR